MGRDKKTTKVFYLDKNGELKYVITDWKSETIKYLKSEGYEIVTDAKLKGENNEK